MLWYLVSTDTMWFIRTHPNCKPVFLFVDFRLKHISHRIKYEFNLMQMRDLFIKIL